MPRAGLGRRFGPRRAPAHNSPGLRLARSRRDEPRRHVPSGRGPASLLFLALPAGAMEGFFETLSGRPDLPWVALEALYERHGMTLLGPPLIAG